jgi:hypothetical protein
MVYGMERGYRSSILLAILTVICAGSAGCLSSIFVPAPHNNATIPIATPTTESPLATLSAGDMALQLSDLPSDYILRDRTAIAYAGISQVFQDLGWQQGYQVSYYRMDKDVNDITTIVQEINLYPLDNVKEVYSLEKEALLPLEDNTTDYQVPFPLQGDRSIAWRETRSGDHGTLVTYTVIFTKKNVYEKISMTGTTTDYEALKDIAQKAVAKIR